MTKSLKRSITLNAMLYIATFVVAAIVLALKGMPLKPNVPPVGQQIFIAMVTGIVLTVFGAWWFFRTEVASLKAGFMFGLTAILVGFAMDGVVSVGIWISGKNPLSFLQTSYSYFFFIIMLGGALFLTSMVGFFSGKRKAMS